VEAKDIYIAQSTVGAANGADCADAQPASWFNSSANWGNGANQIGPGTTVHLCGTFTSAIQFQGSGSSGNVITLHFESGANFTAPVFSPYAIDINGKSYVLIDGGTPCGTSGGLVTACSASQAGTGIIQNTANGTALANQSYSQPVSSGYNGGSSLCGHDVEVKNLLILNTYVLTGKTDSSAGSDQSWGVAMGNACGANISVHDNTITWSNTNIIIGTPGSTSYAANYQIYNNVVQHARWAIVVPHGGSGTDTCCMVSNIYIHDNDVNNYADWSDLPAQYHLDGIFVYGQASGASFNGVYVYNNYLHGNWSDGQSNQCPTGFTYINQNLTNLYIFNNVYQLTGNYACNGLDSTGSNNVNQAFYNNTFLGFGSTVGGGAIGDAGANNPASTTIENNIVYNIDVAINFADGGASTLALLDHNDFYAITGQGQCGAFDVIVACPGSFSAWKACANCTTVGAPDQNGSGGNPNLASSYPFIPQSGSAAIGLGTNLYSICNGQPNPGLGALCFDKAGNARPSSGNGNWDAGAYNHGGSSSGATIQPPSGLTALVQ
jgi:hypothetical protein